MKHDVVCPPMRRIKKKIRLVKEELNSRIEIQERSLHAYSKEIFENIGQVLSLVKLQLQTFQIEDDNPGSDISNSRKLLGKAIADLRSLTKQLSPEEIIKNGFGNAIDNELKRLSAAGFCYADISTNGDLIKLDEVKELVIFCVLQQLTYPLLNIHDPGKLRIGIDYKKDKIEIEVTREFQREPLFLDIESIAKFKRRLKKINASISYGNNSNVLKITIKI